MTLSLGFASVNHGESHLLIWMQMKVLSFLEMYISDFSLISPFPLRLIFVFNWVVWRTCEKFSSYL